MEFDEIKIIPIGPRDWAVSIDGRIAIQFQTRQDAEEFIRWISQLSGRVLQRQDLRTAFGRLGDVCIPQGESEV